MELHSLRKETWSAGFIFDQKELPWKKTLMTETVRKNKWTKISILLSWNCTQGKLQNKKPLKM